MGPPLDTWPVINSNVVRQHMTTVQITSFPELFESECWPDTLTTLRSAYFLQIWTFFHITTLLSSKSKYCHLILRLCWSFASCPVNVFYIERIQFRITCCTLSSWLFSLLQSGITNASVFPWLLWPWPFWRFQATSFVECPSGWLCLMFPHIRFKLCILGRTVTGWCMF